MSLFNRVFSDSVYGQQVGRLDLLFIFLIIIISSETVMFGTNANHFYLIIRQLFCLSLVPLLFVKRRFAHSLINTSASMSFGIVLLILLTISSVVNWEFGPQCIMRGLIILAGFYYVKITPVKIFMIAFEQVVFYIAVAALLTYVIYLFFPQLLSFSLPMENVGGYKYYNFIVSCILDNPFSWVINRLQGPFREPGVAIIYFIYAFAFYLINSEKTSYSRIAVYILVIVLSFSTTGYIALGALICFYVLKNGIEKSSAKENFAIFLIVITSVCLFIYTDVFSSDSVVFGKLSDEENESTISRMASVFTSLDIIVNNPFFGAGIQGSAKLFQTMNAFKYSAHIVDNTNLYMSYAATYGILFASFCTIGIFNFITHLIQSKVVRYLLCVPLMIVFFGEVMFENVFLFILIAYGYNCKKNV